MLRLHGHNPVPGNHAMQYKKRNTEPSVIPSSKCQLESECYRRSDGGKRPLVTGAEKVSRKKHHICGLMKGRLSQSVWLLGTCVFGLGVGKAVGRRKKKAIPENTGGDEKVGCDYQPRRLALAEQSGPTALLILSDFMAHHHNPRLSCTQLPRPLFFFQTCLAKSQPKSHCLPTLCPYLSS